MAVQSTHPSSRQQLSRRLRRALAVLQLERGATIRLLLGGLTIQIVSLAGPYLSSLLIDQVYPSRDVTLMHVVAAASVGVIVGNVWLGHLQVFAGRRLQAALQNDTSCELYRRAVNAPLEYFNARPAGEIGSRVEGARASIAALIAGVQSLARNSAYLVFVPPLLAWTDLRLAAAALVPLPFMAYLSFRQYLKTSARVKNYLDEWARAAAFQVATIAGVRSVKGLAAEHYCTSRYRELAARAAAAQMTRYSDVARYSAAINGLRAASIAACTWMGWMLTLRGDLTLGALVAFLAYLNYLHTPLRDVIDSLAAAQDAAVALDDVFVSLEPVYAAPIVGPACIIVNPLTRPVLECRALSFAYSGQPALWSDISLECDPGTVLVVTGPSGCGKTTFLQILSGLRRDAIGTVSIAGLDSRLCSSAQWRESVSAVWQDDLLIPGSIRENLSMGERLTPTQLERAVALGQLSEVLQRLPAGLDTVVGEGGIMLSAGERQRLAIARTMLRRRPVMLFDEATAHVDDDCERRLWSALFSEQPDAVFVLVTHRPDSVINATQVLDLGTDRPVARRLGQWRPERNLQATGIRPTDDRTLGTPSAAAASRLIINAAPQPLGTFDEQRHCPEASNC